LQIPLFLGEAEMITSKNTIRGSLVIAGALLTASAAKAGGPILVPPGQDCWDIPPGGTWTFGGDSPIPPLPADFFYPGCLPFEGTVYFSGASPTGPDLFIQRPLGFPAHPSIPTQEVPIELVELSLQSVQPFFVPDGSTWDVQIFHSGPTPGQMTVTTESEHGGTFELHLLVQPIYVFTRTEPPFDQRVLDTAQAGAPWVPVDTFTWDAWPCKWKPWASHDADSICGPADNFAPGVFYDPNAQTTCAVPTCLETAGGPGMQMGMISPVAPPCAPPPNDNCVDALPLAGEVVQPFNTLFATHDGDGSSTVGPNVWFQYTALADVLLRISTCGSDYDTKLAVYAEGDCNTAASAEDDNYPGCGLGSALHIAISAGQTIWIEVGGKHDAAGVGWLTVTLDYDVCDTSSPFDRGLYADADDDGDIDLRDISNLLDCFSGDGNPADAGCEAVFNSDPDSDIDLSDVASVVDAMTGPASLDVTIGPMSAICPLPGQLTNAAIPGFSWEPCPDPTALYRLELYRVPPGFDVYEIVDQSAPEFTIDGLTQPQTPYKDNVAPLLPGEQYAWTVEAYDPNDPAITYCSGGVNVLNVQEDETPGTLEDLLKHLEEIRKQLEGEIDDLEDNDLVKEVRLIELLGALLTGEQTLGQAGWDGLVAFINCDSAALNSLTPAQIDTALKALQALISLIIEANDLEGPQKTLLEALHAEIQQVRDGLDDIASIKEFTGGNFDIWQYLQDQIKEGLTDAAKALAEKALAKIAGQKAAGPIISIVLDLWNFGEALFGIFSVDDLKTAWNIVMQQVIEKAAEEGYDVTGDSVIPGTLFTNLHGSVHAMACWTITAVKRCWSPAEGGDPGEGTWVDKPARFDSANGPTTKTFKTEDMADVDGEKQKAVNVHVDSSCTGPCYIGIATKIVRTDGKVDEFMVLTGVIPAPDEGGGDD
jgi:hypothetical protein